MPEFHEQFETIKSFSKGSTTMFEICGHGYHNDPTIPAMHYLKFYEEIGDNKTVNFLKNGFFEIPKKLSENLVKLGCKINLCCNIEKIERSGSKVSLKLNNNSNNICVYDSIIVTCPSEDILKLFSDPSINEKKLLTCIEYIDYCSFIIELTHTPFGAGAKICIFNSKNTYRVKGRIMSYIKPHPIPIVIVYLYKDPNLSLESHISQIEIDIQIGHNDETIKIVKVHDQYYWKNYMPHYKYDNCSNYKLLDSIQGENNTFYCGSLINGELAGSNIKFSKHLIERFFNNKKDLLYNSLNKNALDFIKFKSVRQSIISEFPTFIHSLYHWYKSRPTVVALNWFEKGIAVKSLTYTELWDSIEDLAIKISKVVEIGERVVLLFEPGLSYVLHFYACLRARVIAVPCYPPTPGKYEQSIKVISKILETSSATRVLLSQKVSNVKLFSNNDYFTSTAQPLPFPKPTDIAFLQYTSGSTGDPKGVIIGNDNFQCNLTTSSYWARCDHLKQEVLHQEPIVGVSWLPLYHDMGLSVGLSAPLYTGGTSNIMSPFDFLADPLVWLEICSEKGATGTIAPNFAYGLILRKWDSNRAKKWNLSLMRYMCNSAEPIILSTVKDFALRMKEDVPSLHPRALTFGYGMAECVAFIGTSINGCPVITSNNYPHLVSSSVQCDLYDGICIVDSLTMIECEDGNEGEIFIQSGSVARGYWCLPDLTNWAFKNTIVNKLGYWFRTGDLGIIENNNLFISGRMKDVIIINGRNYWPQDIEDATSHSHVTIKPGSVAAFAITTSDATESFVVVVEIRDSFSTKFGSSQTLAREVLPCIYQAISEVVSQEPSEVVLIKEGTIPKTTSGKIKRKETKELWVTKKLKVILSKYISSTESDGSLEMQHLWIEENIRYLVKTYKLNTEYYVVEARAIDIFNKYRIIRPYNNISEQGVDSMSAVTLAETLKDLNKSNEAFGSINFDHNSIFQLNGVDLLFVICGVVPDCLKNKIIPIFPTPIEESERQKVDFELPFSEYDVNESFSLLIRGILEFLGISALIISVIVAIIPSVYVYECLKNTNLSDHLGLFSIGFFSCLSIPLFLISFTVIWIVQKWIIWGTYKSEFIPMHSIRYYKWWYIDILTGLWETLVFRFIADTILVNFAYKLAGANNISLYASISMPIRCLGLVTIDEYAIVKGNLLTQEVLPHGVCIGPISIGTMTKVQFMSIVNRGCKIEDNVRLDPLSVVPPFTICQSGYIWSGNICERGESWNHKKNGSRVNWWIEQICNLIILIVTLPLLAAIGISLSIEIWLLIFPINSKTHLAGEFWFYCWVYYGNGLYWSLITLLLKWGYFGRAKEGKYTISSFQRLMRWTLQCYNTIAIRLFWTHFSPSLLSKWNRLLGTKISLKATVSPAMLANHPADADLIEIGPSSRVSIAVFSPYNDELQERSKIYIGEKAEVGILCFISGGVRIEPNAKIGAFVYMEPHRMLRSNLNLIKTKSQEYYSPSKSITFGLEGTQLVIPHNLFWYLLFVIWDVSAILAFWLNIWVIFVLLRELSEIINNTFGISILIFLSVWIFLMTCMITCSILFFIWQLIHNSCKTKSAKTFSMMIWKWCYQYRNIGFSDLLSQFIKGTIFVNFYMRLAGSNINFSAKIFTSFMPEINFYNIGKHVIISDQAHVYAHNLWDNELSFGVATAEDFSCLQFRSFLYSGRIVKKYGKLGSFFAPIRDVEEDEYLQANTNSYNNYKSTINNV